MEDEGGGYITVLVGMLRKSNEDTAKEVRDA